MTRRGALSLAAAVLAAASGAAYWYFSPQAQPAAKKEAAPVPVVVAQAATRDVPMLLETMGRAEAYESVTLRARVDGQVAEVAFTEGRHVQRGDLLVRLDPADYAARLRQAEASVARDRAQLAKAVQDVERSQALKSKGFVSEEKVSEVRSAAEAQTSAVRANQAAADLARLQLSYTTIRAPFAGRVGARLLAPGAAVKTNETILAVVNRVQPLYVSFSAPEKYLPRLRSALRAGALHVSVSVPGDSSQSFAGEARFLDNAVDTTTGTIQMKAILPNAEEKLTPGQFVNVSLVLETIKDAVVVAAEAVQQGTEGAFLFVVKADGIAEIRKIRVTSMQRGIAAIAEGLAAGESVVTEGQLRLTPGARVKPAGAEKKSN